MDEHLLEVYLTNTARHTEETPVAEWVSLPTDAETMKAVFERLGVDGSDTEQYQVSAFHSSLDGWSEALKPGESLDDLNYLAAPSAATRNATSLPLLCYTATMRQARRT